MWGDLFSKIIKAFSVFFRFYKKKNRPLIGGNLYP